MKLYPFTNQEGPTECAACERPISSKPYGDEAFRYRKGATIHGDIVDGLPFCSIECGEDYENSLKA